LVEDKRRDKMAEGTLTKGGIEKKKKGFWPKFATFLMMGGWILILVVGLGVVVAVSILFK
jgi:hypothetical protein